MPDWPWLLSGGSRRDWLERSLLRRLRPATETFPCLQENASARQRQETSLNPERGWRRRSWSSFRGKESKRWLENC